ncbi:MAG: PD-(D/E)XK nuclease family protein [Gammaproteobacteria bacterium]
MSKAKLTASRMRAARACQRLHHLQYALGYRSVAEPDALKFGTLVHKGLEAWWLANDGQRLVAAQSAMLDCEADPFHVAKAQVMLTAYDLRWSAEPYDILAVEAAFQCELRNPATGRPSQTFDLAGKIDAIVRDRRDGRVLIVEHKTSSENITPGSEYWRRLRMDGQVSVYFEGARSLGFDVAGCLYDVLSKPGQKPLQVNSKRKTPETPEEYRLRVAEAVAKEPNEYFQRSEVSRLESEMEEAMFDIWQTAQQIRESELANRAPRNPDSCVKWNRTCPYFDVCTGAASLDDTTLFKRTEIHPELSGEQTPKEGAA